MSDRSEQKHKDLMLEDHAWIQRKIQEENLNQLEIWGVQENTLFEWLAYTTEELGELSAAISDYCYKGENPLRITEEAIQVATLSLKIAEMAERIRFSI